MFLTDHHVSRLQGSYTLKMKMFDANKQELTCIGFGFNIGFISTVADSRVNSIIGPEIYYQAHI